MPLKNTAYRVTFPLLDADGDLVTGAAGLDSEISKDGGTFTDCTNEATEIATSSGMYYLDLTSTEMNADTVALIVKTSTSGAKTTPIVLYPVEATDIAVNVTAWNGTAIPGVDTAGYPKVTVKGGTGTGELSIASGVVSADAVALSGDTTAANNAESFFDGTGYAGTNNVIPAVTMVNGLAAGTITAAVIATGAIDADAIATDAVTEIQSGLALASALTTAQTSLSTLEGRLTSARAGYLDALNSGVPLSSAAVDAIIDDAVEGSITMRQALRIMLAVLSGKSTGGGTSTITFRDVADTKARVSATVDASRNRTSVTRDGS